MAEYKFTAALNSATFPLVTRYQPRSVMIGQLDGRLRDPASSNQNNLDNNPQNIPQVTYCENVMPTAEGCVSIGYENVQAAFPGAGTPDDVLILRDDATNLPNWYYCPAQGMNYVTQDFGSPWVSTNPLPGAPLATDFRITVAYVNGKTFICFNNNTVLRWDSPNFVDVTASFVGILGINIRAIAGSGNYLIVIYNDNSIKWSSLTDALDFTPSTTTGAGSQIPVDMKGLPIALASIAGGFLIFNTENIVAASYTQNVAQPWIFREVKNAGGLMAFRMLARDTAGGAAYLFGSFGLQSVNLREAENIHGQVTEFISSKIIENFDTVTNLLAITRVDTIFVKVSFVGGRFLCISYGSTDYEGPFNYALIYDYVFRRWGKLKLDHYYLFQGAKSAPQLLAPLDNMFALRLDGSVDQVVFDGRDLDDEGVLIFGRYQINRTTRICSQEVELEVLDTVQDVTVHVVSNYNGTTVGEIHQMVEYEDTDNYRKFQKQLEGENLSFILKGTFNLATALLTCTKGARF